MNRLLQYKNAYSLYKKNKPTSQLKKVLDLLCFVVAKRIVTYDSMSYIDYAHQTKKLFSKIKINDLDDGYVYPYDTNTVRCISMTTLPIASVTMNYERILKGSLSDVQSEIESLKEGEFKQSLNITTESITLLIDRIVRTLRKKGDNRCNTVANYIERLKSEPCEGFDEAIQRILFVNGLLWQNGHKQNGIGRLDILLAPYYKADIEKGILNRQNAKELLANMVGVLGKDMLQKSAALPGDTGQIIILGGIDSEQQLVENNITRILLEIFKEKPVPDPKLLVKVNDRTGTDIWQKSIDSILTGCGSPLLMNEDLIIDGMKAFGYDDKDTWNFGTSACWEPLIIGKSFDQNNRIKNIPIVESVISALEKKEYSSYGDFESSVMEELRNQISHWPLDVKFDKSPLMTLLFDGCIEKGRDFCDGGAKYNYHGLLVVGLPDFINALLNMRDYVFEKKMFTIKEVRDALGRNFDGNEDMLDLFRNNKNKFGLVDDDVVSLTNKVTGIINDEVEKLKILGNKVKVGFSSPGYIGLAETCPASPDGRKNGEPFAVHISPVNSKIDIHEIFRFAAQMNYSGSRINGNVVDFIIPSSYAQQPEKLTGIVKTGMLNGIFEMQMNVLDKDTLIDAKMHPEKHPNLIVRVWGFSAYFNDLPEQYKDNLIARAEKYESN